jgi:hypothetical protein|tara:strand:+ start:48 stop:251 length:204 start_codon:yes stop_codon:yes gene_type:complete
MNEETEDGMTKEIARDLLNNYIKKYGIPIKDAVLCEDADMSGEAIIYTDWTFKGLLCLVYDDLEIKK